MAWTYSDWATKATVALRLERLNLHIQEVSDRIGNEQSGDGYSKGSGSLATLMQNLLAERRNLEATPGATGTGMFSRVRYRRSGAVGG